MDALAVRAVAARVVDFVRAGGGPAFVEFKTYRFRAHSMFDPELYRPKAEVEEWKRRDPITLLSGRLDAAALRTPAEAAALEREVEAEVEAAVAFAEAGTWEPVAGLLDGVYAERRG
jgi:TPP-dependent pyruvate/acetoin dehydrogenase alpha subunit